MANTLEERVAYLEGKVEEHSRGYGELREMIIHLDSRLNALDQKVDRLREELSRQIHATNQRIDALDQRFAGRLDALDEKFSRYFLWTIGIQIAVLLAVIGALIGK